MSTIDFGDGIPTITIDLEKPCAECWQKGAAPSGLCMKCTTKAIEGRPMKSVVGQAVAVRWREQFKRRS